jgi:DNA uptake protein ComE-like DNA-binding protein
MKRVSLFLIMAVTVLALIAAPGKDLIDINSATVEVLKTLPGIRDAWAASIVKNRPYSNKAQLLSRKIISPAAYRKIRDFIIAKQ